jgi:hypothetical protein
MRFVLLVTWIVYGQPPTSYQTIFNSLAACEAARAAIFADAQRLVADWEKRMPTEFHRKHAQRPTVSAVCAAQ